MSTSSSGEAVQLPQRSPDALAGALASMVTAPAQVQVTNDDRQRNELAYISHLTLQSSQSSQPSTMSSPSPSGTAAAAAATRNAAREDARKRAQSVPRENFRNGQASSSESLPPLPALGSSWLPIKATPPQTDSETEAVRAGPAPPLRPLAAPVPLRPNRAAVVAHAQANHSSSNPPLLDTRTKMTASSLADAMVASSLASQHTGSRVGSPATKPPPLPMPRRRSKSVGGFHEAKHHMHLLGLGSDTPPHAPKLKPLQARTMRQTMRNHSPEHEEVDDEHSKRGRRHWRRHPNMHHEGDRKRWRDKVTERERKRYEGVWAANRGLLLDLEQDSADLEYYKDGTPVSDLVVNVVVRDIWDRSRLPRDVLEEIWDLVSQPGAKALSRWEFVVGLWLVDQRLKGRKSPVKVSSSVWSSVRHTQGVRISNKRL